MGDPRGFLKHPRKKSKELPVVERVQGYAEFALLPEPEVLVEQASRCMDCGIPFCNRGCPLGNLIPEWNDHVYRGDAARAERALFETNNFPEVTGRVCPAPCESSCVLALDGVPVTIKDIERSIADRLQTEGYAPRPPATESGKRVAVIGSGPAGMAAAQQLRRAGHAVVLFERAAQPGGLLRYGIPDFKLDKTVIETRMDQLLAEGVELRTGVEVGVDVGADELRGFDGIVLAVGARTPRDLPAEGRALEGVHFAMEFLTQQNQRVSNEPVSGADILATGKHVVVLGGGDTGSDCVGTSQRQGAASVTQLEILPRPPEERDDDDLWPNWPRIFRTSSSHEEGAERMFAVRTERFVADASGRRVAGVELVEVELDGREVVPVADSGRVLPCDLALLAMGFVSVQPSPLHRALGLTLDARGRVHTADGGFFAAVGDVDGPPIVVAGDAYRGASLVVWAIADGRRAAAALHGALS